MKYNQINKKSSKNIWYLKNMMYLCISNRLGEYPTKDKRYEKIQFNLFRNQPSGFYE